MQVDAAARQAAEGARAREVGDGIVAAGEVTPCRALPGVEAAVALQRARVARGVPAARSGASVRFVPCTNGTRGLGCWAVVGRHSGVTGRHSKPACTPGGAPVCVRRCRSKLFDRGEVYWQPGKVHTCTTGIVSYRTRVPRNPRRGVMAVVSRGAAGALRCFVLSLAKRHDWLRVAAA